jgi:hypothetical protein
MWLEAHDRPEDIEIDWDRGQAGDLHEHPNSHEHADRHPYQHSDLYLHLHINADRHSTYLHLNVYPDPYKDAYHHRDAYRHPDAHSYSNHRAMCFAYTRWV